MAWGEGASWELDKNDNPHEANFLKLDCSKATTKLKWQPVWHLDHTLQLIVDWHKQWKANADMRTHCINEINKYAK